MTRVWSEDSDVPEFYVDSVRIGIGLYGIMLDMGVQSVMDTPMSDKSPAKRLAVVRMSPQHAMVFSKLSARHLAAYEESVGKINLPHQLLENLGLVTEVTEEARGG